MINCYFDIPTNIDRKNVRGSSVHLLNTLLNELIHAKEIHISFFLFNNPYLQKFLEELSKKGCKIKIYSIPLSGYDQKKSTLYVNKKSSVYESKLDYGQKIYKRILRFPAIELKIFPHTYVWHKQKTSRGRNSYSLHNKSILAVFPEETKCISTSCNFALGDPAHSENMLVISNDNSTIQMFRDYFSLLDSWSINYKNYVDDNNHTYVVTPSILDPDKYSNCYFTAPFIKYKEIGSNHYVQNKIIDYILNAKKRIYICGQHVSDINSFDKNSKSIVDSIINKASTPSIDIKILKQTLSSHQKQGTRNVEAEKAMKKFSSISQRFNHPLIHDKFIVVDNILIVTTANFTSTQFAWAEKYSMKYLLDSGEEEVIINTFSEINSFHFIEDQNSVNLYLNHFNKLWDKANAIL
ncbi:hypothetical protein CQS04_09735 [Chryseomicrobium excrementi]|uniref:PLD phosphodiesterase domain-containing protein n=1 Tax=Chryseomicrobium excrementi TaxID=2041346 RepID=A0A2M9EY94_9BACL|nr:phospholipase D-like domain-containing protein [Chryseomicrobium excrementi]PJK16184.1 hypothetical protein CQS04_09735 [Chryseomicrobium excrementi]